MRADENLVLTENPNKASNPSAFEHEDPVVIDTSFIKRDALERKHELAYSIGHFSNDLCAAAWLFFFTYYLKYVIKMNGGQIGIVILGGQIADGCSTILVGFFSDRCKTRIGKRAPWYIGGFFIVLPCYLLAFISPFGIGDPNVKEGDADPNISNEKIAFYIAISSLFNIGWASVQISHMSVVNSLTYSPQKRDKLVAFRNTFTYIANISVLLASLVVFSI